jgi:hypothetical protein
MNKLDQVWPTLSAAERQRCRDYANRWGPAADRDSTSAEDTIRYERGFVVLNSFKPRTNTS